MLDWIEVEMMFDCPYILLCRILDTTGVFHPIIPLSCALIYTLLNVKKQVCSALVKVYSPFISLELQESAFKVRYFQYLC